MSSASTAPRCAAAANARAELLAAVESSPALFRQPRTRLLSGIRVGWRKRPGRIEFDDEEATINANRRKLDGEAAARLIRVSENVARGALRELSARDLMRIGALAVEADDEPIAIPADGEIDKLVAALLDGGEPAERGRAAPEQLCKGTAAHENGVRPAAEAAAVGRWRGWLGNTA